MVRRLVIGAAGQLGIELVLRMQKEFGVESVDISDIRVPENDAAMRSKFLHLDATDEGALSKILEEGQYDEVYHLAAMLSATGEKKPLAAWDLNMQSLLNVLEAAKEGLIKRLFWPSSIAVFGPSTPKNRVPQDAPLDPTTVYGISKQAGEFWCRYYHEKYGVDVRSVRYPGLIGHRSVPGGGTTDYAVDIYHFAAKDEPYTCFLKADQALPMMYMDDAVRGTLELMGAPKSKITVRTSYNLGAMSFTPSEVGESIRQQRPQFELRYAPDQRQAIAASWPSSIDDSAANRDWGWQPRITIDDMTSLMLDAISTKNETFEH
ncbi:NAD-dependent epimerase/dehydratase family protein [Flavobacteriales bacterium]|jgi:nucleoside-diphosphate-sugar epimerase|nr:NAD-dependent epimerase/dehydratase family protein [Flavobacteriales bacterium]MDA8606078.1 NAD-dependent epimerase/dehydratase family protein [Flavobacteriales bacterium]